MASHGNQILALTKSTATSKRCQLANDIGVGDCVQLAGSYVYLFHTDEFDPDLANGVWNTTTYSSHVQPLWHDQWHQSFTFLTDDGKVAATARWDGPEMNDDNRRYSARMTQVIKIDPNLWDLITKVKWDYEC